jgi:MFS family permease
LRQKSANTCLPDKAPCLTHLTVSLASPDGRVTATDLPKSVVRTYLTLTLLSTLAASFIWGVNTLFLLDAGLSNTQAFTVNAFFTLGSVLFEIPTGVVADTRGRKTSYLWGAATLLVSTLLYFWMWQVAAPLWGWAIASILIGLGFTFFSGAVEAWLVDALDATGYEGALESVFGKGQTIAGIAMLGGSVGRWVGGRRVHSPSHQPGRSLSHSGSHVGDCPRVCRHEDERSRF